MRRATKVLSVLATVCAMVWAVSPAWASCPFSLPMLQGGDTGLPPGALLSSATHVNGFFWELGFGDPADGSGNDGNSLISGYPAFTQASAGLQWIKGVSGAREVDYDWFNSGVDNCISGGSTAIATTVLVYYVLDSNDDYAVIASAGTSSPILHNSLDLLNTGVGPNGNDVPVVPLNGNRPQLSNIDLLASTSACLVADVGPATDGVNWHTDTGSLYAGVLDVSGLSLVNGGSPETCDPETGCSLSCIARDDSLCWDGDTLVVAKQAPGASLCVGGQLNGTPCGPVADPNNFCGLLAGVCPPAPPVTTAFGPPIPGDCELIGGPTIDDSITGFGLSKKGQYTTFRWSANQFAVSHFNIIDVKRGRTINSEPIARIGDNDGGMASYEFVATARDLRGAKDFELVLVRTDGQTVRTGVVD